MLYSLCTACSVTSKGTVTDGTDKTKPPISPSVHSLCQFMTPPKPDSAGPFVPLPSLPVLVVLGFSLGDSNILRYRAATRMGARRNPRRGYPLVY